VTTAGLLDTSVYIARESERFVDEASVPEQAYVSVVTVAELHAGVLAAPDTDTRHRRMATVQLAAAQVPLPVTGDAALHWARLRARTAEAGRRVNVSDLWIAAVAVAHDLPVVTQDDDFDVLSELGLVEVIRV
jgi:predicted nucleic acid-binding protein